jgi:MoaA/NifB/PqqE/SkfB family radical SAM enzyme
VGESRARLVVVCQVTDHCNLSCGFCAYDRRMVRARASADPQALLAFGRLLAAYQHRTGRAVLLSWLGGEPLLWPPLRRLDGDLRALGLALAVTTNGTALAAPALRRHLAEHYDEVTVSVDGLGARHDRLRGWPGGFSRLRRAISALAAEERHPLLRVNCVLMRDNVAEFPALCRELARWGVEELTFNQLGGNDRPEFFATHHLEPGHVAWLAEVLPGLRAELAALGVRLRGGDAYLARLAASAARRRLPVIDCGPGERSLFVSTSGAVSPCSFTGGSHGISLGELATVAELPEAFRRRGRAAACHDCHSTQVFGKFAS